MKKTSLAACLLALLVAGLPVLAAEARKVTVNGWIVDEWCKAANAKKDGDTCTLDCHAKGAKLALYEAASSKLYHLDNQKAAKRAVGYVKVTGTLEGDELAVETIERVPEPAGSETR